MQACHRGRGSDRVIIFNSVLLAILLALASKRRNAVDPIGHGRWVAAGLAAMFPYSEVLFYFVGPGTMAQGMQGITWSLLLMPVYAVALAGIFAMFARVSWEDMFAPVVSGLAASWCLTALTEPGSSRWPYWWTGGWALRC